MVDTPAPPIVCPVNKWALDILQRGASDWGELRFEDFGPDRVHFKRLEAMAVGGHISSFCDVPNRRYVWRTTEYGLATMHATHVANAASEHRPRAINLGD